MTSRKKRVKIYIQRQISHIQHRTELSAGYVINMSSLNEKSKFIISDFKHVSEQEIARGKVLNLSQYTYKSPMTGENTWEVAGRCKKPANTEADCVCTLPVLRRMLKYDCLVLVKQYRPPLKAFTLELPAGLTDEMETAQETALRELKEETGYTGTSVKHISPVTAQDPGLSNSVMKILSIEIDGDILENTAPKQSEDDHEKIDVVHIPICELLTRLNEYSEQGIIIDSRVYSFAIGIAVGSKLTRCVRNA